ncbi:MAG: PAS domain S-box protein [Nitrospirae bacterium]|nr:PAS domain S-box protein [Nitrospirota bacterium]
MKSENKIIALVAFLSILLLFVGVLCISGMKISKKAFEIVFNDRVIPMSYIKTVSDMYAINVVDTVHKVISGNITWEQGQANVDMAIGIIEKTWMDYKRTSLTSEEERLISEIEPLLKVANMSIERLKIILYKKDRVAIIEYSVKHLYTDIDPVTNRLNDLEYLQVKVVKQEYQKQDSIYGRVTYTAIGSLIIGLFLTVFVTQKVIKGITKPLTDEITLRKNVEIELYKTKECFDISTKAGKLGVWELDISKDEAWRSLQHDIIFGYGSLLPQWGAKILFEHVLAEDRDMVKGAFDKAMETGELFFECRIAYPDGSMHWITTQGKVYYNTGKTPLLMRGVVQDITERKIAETYLKINSEIMENIPDGVALVRFEDDVIVYTNPILDGILGYDRNALLGKTITALNTRDDILSENVILNIKTALLEEGIWRGEVCITKKDSTVFYYKTNTSIFDHHQYGKVWILIFADITEQKRLERLFSYYMDNIDAYVYLEDRDCNYTFINKKTEQLFNITRDELSKRKYNDFDFFDKNAVEEVILKNNRNVIDNGQHLAIEEAVGVLYNNTNKEIGIVQRYYMVLKFPLRDERGNITGLCGFSYDITARKKLEEDVRLKSEIISNMSEGVVLASSKDGSIIYTNPRLNEMFDYDGEELLGKNIVVLNIPTEVPAEDIERESISSFLYNKGIWEGTVYNIRKDGISFWSKVSISIFEHYQYGKVWILMFTDTTKDKMMTDALLESNSLMHSILQSTFDGILSVNKKGKIMFFNDKFIDMWRIPESLTTNDDDENLLNHVLEQLIYPEQFIDKVRYLYNKPDEIGIDVLEFKDGRIFERYTQPQKINDITIGRIWSFRDITYQMELEERNRYNSKLFDIIFNHALDCIVFLDKDFNFVRVSKSYADVCQRDMSDFIGRNHFELYPSNLHEEAEDAKRQRNIYSRKERIFAFSDHPEWGVTYWDIGLVPILDEKGEIELFLFTLRDVTEQRRVKDELKALNESLTIRVSEEVEKNRLKDRQLFEQSRYISMGELLTNISHQWRQPLGAIGALMQDIQDAYKYSELDEAYLENSVKQIIGELTNLSKTIDTFRGFYLRNEETTEVNISDAVNNTLMLLDAYFKSSSIVIETYLDTTIKINTVTKEFLQVVLNLLTNAKDVLEDRKVVNGRIKIRLYRDSQLGLIVLTIADNAGGVKDELIDRVFEPYFTTKFKSSGTGLGLYTVKTIVEKIMHGSISVRNTDEGCEFRVELPS